MNPIPLFAWTGWSISINETISFGCFVLYRFVSFGIEYSCAWLTRAKLFFHICFYGRINYGAKLPPQVLSHGYIAFKVLLPVLELVVDESFNRKIRWRYESHSTDWNVKSDTAWTGKLWVWIYALFCIFFLVISTRIECGDQNPQKNSLSI